MIGFFPHLLMILAIPMIYSLTYFILERRRNPSKKSYLKYIFLFPIFYVLFFVLYFLFSYCIDFITSILYKYAIPENTIVIILEFIFLFLIIGFYIFLIKKYFNLNDINLFLSIKIILSFIIICILIKLDYYFNYKDQNYILSYFFYFIPLCWILFFINVIVQQINSEKNQKQSDSNPSEIDAKKEG